MYATLYAAHFPDNMENNTTQSQYHKGLNIFTEINVLYTVSNHVCGNLVKKNYTVLMH